MSGLNPGLDEIILDLLLNGEDDGVDNGSRRRVHQQNQGDNRAADDGTKHWHEDHHKDGDPSRPDQADIETKDCG